MWIGSLAFNIITFLIINYKIRPTTEPLALHYNVITGVDTLGQGINLYRIPFIGISLLVVNLFFSKLVKSPKGFLSFVASFTSFAVSIILLVSILFILNIN
jgi:hypothetical protein